MGMSLDDMATLWRWGARTIPLKLMRNINWHMTHVSVIWLIEPCNQ